MYVCTLGHSYYLHQARLSQIFIDLALGAPYNTTSSPSKGTSNNISEKLCPVALLGLPVTAAALADVEPPPEVGDDVGPADAAADMMEPEADAESDAVPHQTAVSVGTKSCEYSVRPVQVGMLIVSPLLHSVSYGPLLSILVHHTQGHSFAVNGGFGVCTYVVVGVAVNVVVWEMGLPILLHRSVTLLSQPFAPVAFR